MSPRTEEQFEEIRKSRKYQILEAALEVFAQEGYHKASISKIATQAGISKGLMYNYFSSKEELLKAVVEHGIEGIQDSFNDIDDDLDTPEELMIFIRGGINVIRQESHFYKLYFVVLFQADVYEIVKEKYQEMVGSMIEDVACYFKLKGHPYPLEKAMVLGSLLDRIGMNYLMAPEMYNLDIIEKIIFDIFK